MPKLNRYALWHKTSRVLMHQNTYSESPTRHFRLTCTFRTRGCYLHRTHASDRTNIVQVYSSQSCNRLRSQSANHIHASVSLYGPTTRDPCPTPFRRNVQWPDGRYTEPQLKYRTATHLHPWQPIYARSSQFTSVAANLRPWQPSTPLAAIYALGSQISIALSNN